MSRRGVAVLVVAVWAIWFGTAGWEGAVTYAGLVVLTLVGIRACLRSCAEALEATRRSSITLIRDPRAGRL